MDNYTSIDHTADDSRYDYGLAVTTALHPYSSECSNLDMQKAENGMEFEINCRTNNVGFDLCPDEDTSCRWHAESLDDCLNLCSTNHPLCAGVVWAMDLSDSWLNCYPKQVDTPASNRIYANDTVWAPAQLTNLTYNCPSDSRYTSASKVDFEVHCGAFSANGNYSSQHLESAQACMDLCANSTSSDGNHRCLSTAFDTYMLQGYENCYLINETASSTMQQAGFILSIVQQSPASASHAPEAQPKSESKAWIAGVVIGGLAALLIIAAITCTWRRKRARWQNHPGQDDMAMEKLAGELAPAPAVYEIGIPPKRYESAGTPLNELPGVIPTDGQALAQVQTWGVMR